MRRFHRQPYPFKIICYMLIFSYFCSACACHSKIKTSEEHYLSKIENNLIPKIQIENEPIYYTLQERMEHYGAIGFSLTTIRNFKIEDSKGFGYCRKEEQINVENQSRFMVGSISKSITSLVVLKLQEKRILNIDTDIRSYLTSWKLPENEYTKNTPITLRMLIQHRSGLKKNQIMKAKDQGFIEGDKIYSLEELLNGKTAIQAISFDSKPGEIYKYSNQGYNLIQKILEDITEKRFEELAKEMVLEPFEMTNSTFETVFPNPNNHNYCYAYKNEKVHEGFYRNTNQKSGGGLFSTSEDLAKFSIKIANIVRGKDPFLSQKLAHQIFTGEDYGLGFDLIKKDSLLLFSHSGRTPGFYSFMAMNPENGDGFVMLVNSDGMGDLLMEMLRSTSKTFDWNIWSSKLITSISIHLENYKNYLGTYLYKDEKEEYKVEITIKNKQLYYIEFDENETFEYPLIPISKNIFIDGIDGDKIEFNKNDKQEITLIYDDEYIFKKD